jgi:hypothetical protein
VEMFSYTKATETRPRDGGDEDAPGFSVSKTCCFSLQFPTAYVNQPKALVASEVYHVIININRLVDGMDRLPEGHMGNYSGWGSVKTRGICGRARCMCPCNTDVTGLTYM